MYLVFQTCKDHIEANCAAKIDLPSEQQIPLSDRPGSKYIWLKLYFPIVFIHINNQRPAKGNK